MKGEMKGEKDEQQKRIIRQGRDCFGREVARIAVAQVCQNTGFETFYESALVSLADIAIRYIGELGKSSMFYAGLSRRTECNIIDVIRALEDLALFQGTSKINSHCVVNSDAMLELKKYAVTADEIPFARSLPRFPAIRDPKRITSFSHVGFAPRPRHIPAWLPAFPDPDTYIPTPVWNDGDTEPRGDEIELAGQHGKDESSIVNSQQWLPSNGLQDKENTPKTDYLENQVSLHPKVSAKKSEEEVSTLLQTFSPVIEAMRDRLDRHSDKGAPSKRPLVILEFKSSKKLCEPVDIM